MELDNLKTQPDLSVEDVILDGIATVPETCEQEETTEIPANELQGMRTPLALVTRDAGQPGLVFEDGLGPLDERFGRLGDFNLN